MKWCKISKKIGQVVTELEIEVTAMLMREEVYDEYRNGKFVSLKQNGRYYSILLKENEEFNENIDLNSFKEDEIKIDSDSIRNEVNYLTALSSQTLSQIFGYAGVSYFSSLFKTQFETKIMGSFTGRGGLILYTKKDDWKIEIKLNYMDMYEVSIYKDKKLISKSDELFFSQLFDYIKEIHEDDLKSLVS